MSSCLRQTRLSGSLPSKSESVARVHKTGGEVMQEARGTFVRIEPAGSTGKRCPRCDKYCSTNESCDLFIGKACTDCGKTCLVCTAGKLIHDPIAPSGNIARWRYLYRASLHQCGGECRRVLWTKISIDNAGGEITVTSDPGSRHRCNYCGELFQPSYAVGVSSEDWGPEVDRIPGTIRHGWRAGEVFNYYQCTGCLAVWAGTPFGAWYAIAPKTAEEQQVEHGTQDTA